MLQKVDNTWYQSTLLAAIPGLLHGYSSRRFGDVIQSDNRHSFLQTLHLGTRPLIWLHQVHGTRVADAGSDPNPTADAVFYRQNGRPVPVLSIHAGDCVPILFVEPHRRIIAAAHAGWRGTLAGISRAVCAKISQNGGDLRETFVSLGPRIGRCCYAVSEQRAWRFLQAFGNDEHVVGCDDCGIWSVDLAAANVRQLLISGVQREHIDAPPSCTSCQKEDFFSFRRDGAEKLGEIMGVITFT